MYLQITNSDGDTRLRVTNDFPGDDYLEGLHIRTLPFLHANPDSNYWGEDVTVIVEVQDARW